MQQDMTRALIFWSEVQTGLPLCFSAVLISFLVLVFTKFQGGVKVSTEVGRL